MFLQPDQFMSTFFFLQAFGGFFNGYIAAKLYQFFNGSSWILLVALACTLYPVSLFTCYFIIDLVDEDYSARLFSKEGVSSTTYFLLWLFSNLPGASYAAYSAFLAPKIDVPTKQTRLARDIPTCDAKMRRFRALCCSLLPFFALYLQFGKLSSSFYSLAGAQSGPKSQELELKGVIRMTTTESQEAGDSYALTVFLFTLITSTYLLIVA